MSIVIRHGTNGAFKTATAVDAYVIPALKEGRTIVTNVRGLTREKAFEKWPDLPESLEIINIDSASEKGKERIARWFHWVPLGALLVFDEASTLFPKAWRESDIRKLDYPGGEDQAAQDNRPPNWSTAWEMHRHYNWDVVLTTPNIKGIRDDIRGTTEMAFRHRNLGALSSKFRYIKELQHDAQKNGFSPSDAINLTTRRVSKDVFDLYDTTTTGLHQGSKAGKSLLTNPKILFLLVVVAGVVAMLANTGGVSLFQDDPGAGVADRPSGSGSNLRPVPVDRRPGDQSASRDAPGDVPARQRRAPDRVAPFAAYEMNIVGRINDTLQIEARRDGDAVFLTLSELYRLGYRYSPVNDCMGKLIFQGVERLILCVSNDERRTVQREQQSISPMAPDGA